MAVCQQCPAVTAPSLGSTVGKVDVQSTGARLVCRGGMTRGSNKAGGRCKAVR